MGGHTVEQRSDVVVKRFRERDVGQHEREWRALTLLAEHAPGQAPEPVRPEQITALADTVTKAQVATCSARRLGVTWAQAYGVVEVRAGVRAPAPGGHRPVMVREGLRWLGRSEPNPPRTAEAWAHRLMALLG